MNSKSNRREFLNNSIKAGALMLVPFYGTSFKKPGILFSDREVNDKIIIRRTPLTTKDYLEYPKRFSNWGRWGKDDHIGTLNFINDEKRKEAVKLVKAGTTISCARALDTNKAPDNPFPTEYKINIDQPGKGMSWTEGKTTGAVDFIRVCLHGFVITHVDALNHIHTNDGRMYNGRPVSDIKPTGAISDSIDFMKDGIISRGIYFDIPELRNARCVTPDKPVQGWELEDYALKHKIVPRSGDIVIIDCGREKYWEDYPNASRVQGEKPGLDPSVLEFFYKYNSAVLGCDFDEAKFSAVYNSLVPVHAIANPYMGLPTIWSLDLNRLREKCKELNRHDFLFMITPLIIPGGTSSIVNPVAMF